MLAARCVAGDLAIGRPAIPPGIGLRYAVTRRLALSWLLAFGLVLPWVGKPPHVDDPNFLRLAEGARVDPWRPHDVLINWGGVTETAFDVLSNPPGIAWWLAPAVSWPAALQHLWMLPWLLVALAGMAHLARALHLDPATACLLLASSPVVVLAAGALTPDLALLACTTAGLALVVDGRRPGFGAILAGCAVLFRYSGLAILPVVGLVAWFVHDARRPARLRTAPLTLVPLALLLLHDLHAYGRIHVFAMAGFQGVSDAPVDLLHKLLAALGALGGAVLLPVVALRRATVPAALAGAVVGFAAAPLLATPWLPATLAVAAGAATLSVLRPPRGVDAAIVLWALGGLAFLLLLRFTAARYWLPFLPPLVLLALRGRPSGAAVVGHVVLSSLLATLLAADDARLARAQAQLAAEVDHRFGPGLVAGHWGWQHALEAAGWTPLEEGQPAPSVLATSEVAWPQEPAPGCRVGLADLAADAPFGLRAHTRAGAGNLHASWVAGRPPLRTVAPWGFADDPYDLVTVSVPCRPDREAPRTP